MSDSIERALSLPPEQQAIRDKCFHPSGTFVEFPMEDVETSIPARFEKIVRLYPDKIAIETDHGKVTYAQLNAAANRLARQLFQRSLSRDVPIGLLFDKRVEQIIAIIAVLKARHSFVVVESSLPETRMHSILDDCATQFIITNLRNSASATQLVAESLRVLVCDTIEKDFSGEDNNLAISPNDIAFITYTSGSTGRPKAVVHTHKIFLRSIMLRVNSVRWCPADRVSNLSSGGANALSECLHALLTGAALVPFAAQQASAARLRDYLKNKKITICQIASPLFRRLCDVLTTEDEFPELRMLRLRSETVKKSDVALYKTYFARTAVMANGLSSSECYAITQYYLDGATEIGGDDVPVGYPVPGMEISLLDDDGDQVGFNEVGEIVIRSAYHSPGYLHNPELTAAKFKLDPKDPNKRLYFTGDLGLMLPDGCLVHKGRKDARIKIRGYGVDLNEVKAALCSHTAIRDAVVVDRKDQSGESRLAAYFTSLTEQGPTTHQLRQYLSNLLADFMVPAVFVRMEVLPLTVNGKLDHNALPKPDNRRPELSTPYAGPGNETEESLVQIWEQVLDVRPIGIHDNFFDLGGHSLAASRIITRVIQTFQLELPVKALFDAPTVAEMSKVILENRAKGADPMAVERILSEIEAMSEEKAKGLLKPEIKEELLDE